MPTGLRSRRTASISTAVPFEVGTSTDDGARIVIQFAETLDGNHLPAADTFGYAVNFGATTTLSTVSLSGSAVTLGVSGIITGDDLHVEYAGGTSRANYLRDLVGDLVQGRLTACAGNGIVPPSVTVSVTTRRSRRARTSTTARRASRRPISSRFRRTARWSHGRSMLSWQSSPARSAVGSKDFIALSSMTIRLPEKPRLKPCAARRSWRADSAAGDARAAPICMSAQAAGSSTQAATLTINPGLHRDRGHSTAGTVFDAFKAQLPPEMRMPAPMDGAVSSDTGRVNARWR